MFSKANIVTVEEAVTETQIELDESNKTKGFRTTAFDNFGPSKQNISSKGKSESSEEVSARAFSSALVSSKIDSLSSEELEQRVSNLMESPAIQQVLRAARDFADDQGITEKAAAEQILESVKELSHLWDKVLIKQGLSQISKNSVH